MSIGRNNGADWMKILLVYRSSEKGGKSIEGLFWAIPGRTRVWFSIRQMGVWPDKISFQQHAVTSSTTGRYMAYHRRYLLYGVGPRGQEGIADHTWFWSIQGFKLLEEMDIQEGLDFMAAPYSQHGDRGLCLYTGWDSEACRKHL